MWTSVLAISFGAAIGALIRWGLGVWLNRRGGYRLDGAAVECIDYATEKSTQVKPGDERVVHL